jgi:phenylacetate-CoA ligase
LHSFLGPDLDGSLRQKLEDAWGAPVYDSYGSHEVGQIAFECKHRDRKHISEDMAYVETVDVESNVQLPPGKPGNLVITSLHRSVPPIIRYNIRDLLILYEREPCACGMTTRKLSTFLGRSDEMVKLRGNNVYPLACQETIVNEPRVTDDYLCVAFWVQDGGTRREEMNIRVERRSPDIDAETLALDLSARLNLVLGAKVGVEVVESGMLADYSRVDREGKPRRLLDLRRAPTPYRPGAS